MRSTTKKLIETVEYTSTDIIYIFRPFDVNLVYNGRVTTVNKKLHGSLKIRYKKPLGVL